MWKHVAMFMRRVADLLSIYFLVPRVADSDEQTVAGGPASYKSGSHQCMSAVGRDWASNQRLFEG